MRERENVCVCVRIDWLSGMMLPTNIEGHVSRLRKKQLHIKKIYNALSITLSLFNLFPFLTPLQTYPIPIFSFCFVSIALLLVSHVERH